MTIEELADAVVLGLVLEANGPMDDIVVLMAAKNRAISEDGNESRSKVLQEAVCTKLFKLGYEYDEPWFLIPESETHRELILRANFRVHVDERPVLSLAPGE